jgi:hypothetical protein
MRQLYHKTNPILYKHSMAVSSFYKRLFIYLLYIFIIITVITLMLLSGLSAEINEDWERYKCEPYVIPFAGYIKKDKGDMDASEFTNQNFIDCTSRVMYPISEMAINTNITPMIGTMTSTSGMLQKGIKSSFDLIMTRFKGIFSLMMGNLYDVIHSIMDSTKTITMRIEFMIKRLGSIMTVIIYKLFTLVRQQEAIFDYGLKLTKIILSIGLVVGIFNPPIMAFTLTMIGLTSGFLKFCFHPSSKIRINTGEYIPLFMLSPGEKLYGNEIVRNVFYLQTQHKPFVKIGNIYCTNDHPVFDASKNEFVSAILHPKMKNVSKNELEPTNYVICFNTNKGSFYQDGNIISDYDNNPKEKWMDGIEKDMIIPKWNRDGRRYKWTKLDDIRHGDYIGLNKARVYGIVHTIKYLNDKNLYIHHADKKWVIGDDTVILNGVNPEGKIIRKNCKKNMKNKRVLLITFITNKGEIRVRDDLILCDYEYDTRTQIIDPSGWNKIIK